MQIIFGIELMPGTSKEVLKTLPDDPLMKLSTKFSEDASNPCAGEAAIGGTFLFSLLPFETPKWRGGMRRALSAQLSQGDRCRVVCLHFVTDGVCSFQCELGFFLPAFEDRARVTLLFFKMANATN